MQNTIINNGGTHLMDYKLICELMEKYEIGKLQNMPLNQNSDVMTICAFFTTEEQFANHAKHLKG